MEEAEREGRRSFISLVEIERDELDENSGGWVTFDSFAASVIDDVPRSTRDDFLWSHMFFELPERMSGQLLTLRVPLRQVLQRYPEAAGFDSAWVRISVDARPDGEMIVADVVLFGDAAETPQVGIVQMLRLDSETADALDYHAREIFRGRASSNLIAGVLDWSLQWTNASDLSVAVYDVGQGNCNALVDGYGWPHVYFDMGWSPNFHAKTRPTRQPNFFYDRHSSSPSPIVLSHWDMDHWCYAISASSFDAASLTTEHVWRPGALERFWIARVPEDGKHKLGPLTQTFYRALHKSRGLYGIGPLLLWPHGVGRIAFSAGWLEACQPVPGIPNDRNNSGIVMFVRPGEKSASILLTGDADFPHIPSIAGPRKVSIAGLVAPHHGARVTVDAIPKPKRHSSARLVMSVGSGNSYGHPKKEAIEAYEAKGWHSSSTQSRFNCDCRDEEHLHGNTRLMVDNSDQDPKSPYRIHAGSLCLHAVSAHVIAPTPGVKKRSKWFGKAKSIA